ncbi:hypothetical protein ACLBKS_14475 [Hylemonella sp. W303a]|uniref:hypothetical protein n=1 Tax=Hylemonella sp. W303a TaxID=3389873 RepID=UPI00396B17E9
MGPITLFDKSFLQGLSLDEAVWFDNFFYPVIAPLFYIETLADLYKAPRNGKTPEEEVGIIAAKTPQLHGGPCYFHMELCIQDLLGNPVPLTGQIPMAGMRQVIRSGKQGAIAEVSREARAFHRWQRGDFFEVERFSAREWRTQVENIDLSAIEHAMKQIGINSKTCKSLGEALKLADSIAADLTKTPFRFDGMLEVLKIPLKLRLHIKDRWKRKGKPPLRIFAPYANHILRVELFFRAALGANLVASTRSSHKVDMAYLFYLPFCTLFTSSDKLHRQCAPLFMRPNQEFVWGIDLKADLATLSAHYGAMPTQKKQQGIYKFANRLPTESQGLIRKLFEKYTPNLLEPATAVNPEKIDGAVHEKLLEDIKRWESASTVTASRRSTNDDLEAMIIKREVSRTRGSWVQIGPEMKDQD